MFLYQTVNPEDFGISFLCNESVEYNYENIYLDGTQTIKKKVPFCYAIIHDISSTKTIMLK